MKQYKNVVNKLCQLSRALDRKNNILIDDDIVDIVTCLCNFVEISLNNDTFGSIPLQLNDIDEIIARLLSILLPKDRKIYINSACLQRIQSIHGKLIVMIKNDTILNKIPIVANILPKLNHNSDNSDNTDGMYSSQIKS